MYNVSSFVTLAFLMIVLTPYGSGFEAFVGIGPCMSIKSMKAYLSGYNNDKAVVKLFVNGISFIG